MSTLTKAQRIALAKNLTPAQHKKILKAVRDVSLKGVQGGGIMNFVKAIGKTLGKVGRYIGPTVIHEVLIPIVRRKLGGTLNIPGMGKKKRYQKKR